MEIKPIGGEGESNGDGDGQLELQPPKYDMVWKPKSLTPISRDDAEVELYQEHDLDARDEKFWIAF